ncbi:hypothetical protein GCM10023093_01110 [Nemorincola caseinilytica]|uniref:Phosphoribosylformylglycinamidine synthase n=1 Tax=Nemorincola caseinilytica TaxID=2054315 RepID=A0ABP8N4E8_9BACT
MVSLSKVVSTVSFLAFASMPVTYAQVADEKERLDSLYIEEVEDGKHRTDKVLHAEPLYIDLIRDLGARKGEHELNIGLGITDNQRYDHYTTLVEYEFAPIDRLGLEVELPFLFYYPNQADVKKDSIPFSRVSSLKTAAQYSFYVSEKHSTSMAIGYIHEVLLPPLRHYGKVTFVRGHGYNPFFVAAKRLGNNFHTLLYTGPYIEKQAAHSSHTEWHMNSNLHYMIPGTRNFIGLELNKKYAHNGDTNTRDFDMTIRPQMRLAIADNLMIGIVAGVPIKRENERFSTFMRLIYEPGSRSSAHNM